MRTETLIQEDVARYILPEDYKVPSNAELTRLAIKAKTDPAAFELVVHGSLRFIIQMVSDKQHALPYLTHVSTGDLIGEGVAALGKAVEKYEPGHSCGFLTYAKHWINRNIMESLRKNGRLGTQHAHSTLRSIKKATDAGIDCSDHAALAKVTGCAVETISNAIMARSMVSMETVVGGDDNELRIEDRLAADTPSPRELVERDDRKSQIQKMLARLDERSRRIVMARFMAEEQQTRTAIGKELGCTPQNIDQCERRVLEKLERMMSKKGISSHLDI